MTLTDPSTYASGRPTVPWSWYSDPAQLNREVPANLPPLRGSARAISESCRAQGATSRQKTGPVPIVITRATDGVLRGFVNVCRHRGAILARPAPSRASTHAVPVPPPGPTTWMAGCGPLRAAPRIPRSRPATWAWSQCRSAPWGRFLLANPDPSAEPLADALGDLPAVVAEHDLDVDALRFNRRVRYEIRANWKIALENYLECYHCPVDHSGLVEVIDERRLELVAHGQRASQLGPGPPPAPWRPRADRRQRRTLAQRQTRLSLPTLKLGGLPGHPNLSVGPLWRTGPETCAGYLDYWFAESASEGWIEELFVLDDQVGAEDTALVEAAQRGSRRG